MLSLQSDACYMLFFTCYDISPPKCDYLSYNACQSPLIIIIVIIITITIIIIIIIPFANCHYHVLPLILCQIILRQFANQRLPTARSAAAACRRSWVTRWKVRSRSLAVSERRSCWMTWMKCGMKCGMN